MGRIPSHPSPPSPPTSYPHPPFSSASLPARAWSTPPLYHTTLMLSHHLTPEPGQAAYRETSAQLAVYSRTLFEFTLRLWSESRRRAEELRKLEESAAILNLTLSRPSQVRTGSMRSTHNVDANSQQ